MTPEFHAKLKAIMAANGDTDFVRYHDGNLWYAVAVPTSGMIFGPVLEFPVPISDIGNATFGAVERSRMMMRYIRKRLELLEEAKEKNT